MTAPAPKDEQAQAVALTHARSCQALCGGVDDVCTCGLHWRIQHQTAMELLAAWQKRAYEAETALAAAEQERDHLRGLWMDALHQQALDLEAMVRTVASVHADTLSYTQKAEQERDEARRLLERAISYHPFGAIEHTHAAIRAFLARPDSAPPTLDEMKRNAEAKLRLPFNAEEVLAEADALIAKARDGAPPQKAELPSDDRAWVLLEKIVRHYDLNTYNEPSMSLLARSIDEARAFIKG